MKVQFEATLDDFADTMFRGWIRHEPSYWQRFSQYIFTAFLLAGFAVVPIFMYFSWEDVWVGVVTFFLILSAYFYFHRPVSNAQYKALCYEAARKRLGDAKTALVEVELSEKGLLTRSLCDEYIFAWANISEIEETEDAVYFFRNDTGACSVRKRALVSAEQTARFLAIAKTYQQSAEQLLNA